MAADWSRCPPRPWITTARRTQYCIEYTRQSSGPGAFDAAVDALEAEGFGVLCDIDAQATFEEKLGEEFRQYRILGAYKPVLAHEGLTEAIDLGALLPCNVVVYETDDGAVVVSAVDPRRLVGIADDEALDPIATEVHDRFDRVLASVAEAFDRSERLDHDPGCLLVPGVSLEHPRWHSSPGRRSHPRAEPPPPPDASCAFVGFLGGDRSSVPDPGGQAVVRRVATPARRAARRSGRPDTSGPVARGTAGRASRDRSRSGSPCSSRTPTGPAVRSA